MAGKLEKQKAKAIRETFEDITYLRWVKEEKGHERGCVDINALHLHAYGHIKRVLNLENGIKANFKNAFYVQEKVDGYNVRVISLNGNLYAFSRSGYIEAFATEKLRNDKLYKGIKYLADNGFIVCGEMLGNTPYTRPREDYDYMFLVFDLIKDGKFLMPDEIEKHAKKYDIKVVPYYGIFDPNKREHVEKLKNLVKSLNEQGKEGIVMKNHETRIKYVFANNEARHFSKAHEMLFDFPSGYFQERLLRAALFKHDFNAHVEVDPINAVINGLNKFIEKGYVYSTFRIRVDALTTWLDIKKRLRKSKEISIKEVEINKLDGKYEIIFERIYKKTTNKLKAWLNGKAFED
ncbi:MAG: RNA ligase [Candidatus Anstonellales archaeon]